MINYDGYGFVLCMMDGWIIVVDEWIYGWMNGSWMDGLIMINWISCFDFNYKYIVITFLVHFGAISLQLLTHALILIA